MIPRRRACVVRLGKIACVEPSRVLQISGRLDGAAAGLAFAAARAFIAEPDGPQRRTERTADE